MFMPFIGTSPAYDDHSRFPTFLMHTPSGSSLKCLEHFKQLLLKDKNEPDFTKFDHGAELNLARYGQSTPPAYDLNLLRVPVHTIVGRQDPLSNKRDVQILHERLKRFQKQATLKTVDNCGHMTYSWGKEVDWMLEFVHECVKDD